MKSVVIPVVAGIGNALMAAPMVRALKRARPAARVTVLARTDAMGEVFRRLREVDEVVVTGKGLKGNWRKVSEARRRRADVYLVPFPSNRWQYSLLAATSGAKRKILHSYPVGRVRSLQFIGERILAQRGIHDVEQNLRLLGVLGIEPGEAQAPRFEVTDADRAAAPQVSLSDPIVIHAGSARTILAQAKRWPVEFYGALIDTLQAQGAPVILLEGPDERGVASEILGHIKSRKPQIVALNGPLGEAAAMLQRARLYVGSDSGLAHLAAAVGTAPVTLFGPADPDRVCPFGYRHLVVQAPTPCAPCFKYPYEAPYPKMCCREPFCIRQISIDAVMATVNRALSQASNTSPSAPAGTAA